MWAAVGNCHEKLGRISEAIKAYKRALLGDGTLDLSYLMKIGDLHKQFKACLEIGGDGEVDLGRARLWVQKYEKH